MKTITKIEQQKKRADRVSIYLDGDFFCGLPQFLLERLDLFQGKNIDEDELLRIVERKLIEEAKQKVLRLLNRRLYSEKEILDKLNAKGYEDHIVSIVVSELKEISIIDDRAFTRAFVSDRLRLKPEGSFKIALELRKKGISREVIERAFNEAQVVDGDRERALDIARRRLLSLSAITDRMTKKRRLSSYLARRGFSFEIIRETLDLLLP
jgi:regulatory protein